MKSGHCFTIEPMISEGIIFLFNRLLLHLNENVLRSMEG